MHVPFFRIGRCTTPRLQGRPLFWDWFRAGTLPLHVVSNCFMNTIGCDVTLNLTILGYFSKVSRM